MGVHRLGAHRVDLQPGGAGADALDHVAVQRVADPQHVPRAGRRVPRQASAGRPRTRQVDGPAALPDDRRRLAPATSPSRPPGRPARRCRDRSPCTFSGCGRATLTLPGPLDHGRRRPTIFLAACSGVTHGPPAFQPLHRFTVSTMPQPVRLAHGVLEELAPRGAHELRPARRVGPGLAGVEQQRPGDPLFLHLLEVAGDALLARRAVEPPPVAPRLRGIRRVGEAAGQVVVGPSDVSPLQEQ